RQLLDSINFLQSLSNTACPYDNAVAESFFKFLKKEEISRRKFLQLEDVKQSIMSYIDGFYDTKRPHSANNEFSPNDKAAEFWTKI
ncbi:MAG: integrase core domain-containing protein, partial [Synergistaceae bacterium]|nr:integrase core domain-containing protein [Synergistaceae bacterium]